MCQIVFPKLQASSQSVQLTDLLDWGGIFLAWGRWADFIVEPCPVADWTHRLTMNSPSGALLVKAVGQVSTLEVFQTTYCLSRLHKTRIFETLFPQISKNQGFIFSQGHFNIQHSSSTAYDYHQAVAAVILTQDKGMEDCLLIRVWADQVTIPHTSLT